MIKIAVIGLGLIGGSICKSLKAGGNFFIGGQDIDAKTTLNALNEGIIDEKIEKLDDYDIVYIATTPTSIVEIIRNNSFKDGAIVIDICGIKEAIKKEADRMENKNFIYVGCHPMAGKEVSGLKNSSEKLFKNASYIICREENSDRRAIEVVKELARIMGFSKMVETTAKNHDEIIALTSQLAHIISNSYVKSKNIDKFEGFTGGSFQDMTRIASLNSEIWTELFFYNRENIIGELENIIGNLNGYLSALKNEDNNRMRLLLDEGSQIKDRICGEKADLT